MEHAVPVAEQIQVKLHQLAKGPNPGEAFEHEVRELAEELGVILDEAEAIKAADGLSQLKVKIQKITRH